MKRNYFAIGMWLVASIGHHGWAQNAIRSGENAEKAEESVTEADQRAKELAVAALAETTQIDKLPRFFIRAHAGTRIFKVMANATDNRLENLLQALDEPVVEEDWGRYEVSLAWDEKRFLSELQFRNANDPGRFSRWGTRQLAGYRHQSGDRPITHVLRADAAAMWKDEQLSNPNYLKATLHQFWWGDTSHRNPSFSAIPPSDSPYRLLGATEFDGEVCDLVESRKRREGFWISQRTGRIRGYLNCFFNDPRGHFYDTAAVKEITGQSFSTENEYRQWLSAKYPQLAFETKRQLSKAFNEWIDVDKTRVSLIVRFRDFREIAPGIWWPFREDRAQGYSAKEGFDCMRSDYVVDEVRTDADLSDTVKALLPQEGEQVQDQRYAAPVNYDFRAERKESDILKLVDIEYQKLLRGKEALNRFKQPVEALVGKPAPALPEHGWIDGPRPNLAGKPFLIHFWATWCGPCKNDLPILKQMARDGVPIVGMHPAGTPASEVENVMKEFELGYPTFVESTIDSRLSGRTIAGYPADIFPYCILVDHQGNVAGHGMLRDTELIKKLRELQKIAAGK